MATVQQAEISHSQVSTLFWINVLISLVFLLLTVALSPIIAWIYKETRLVWVTVAFSSAFLFGGLTVQHQALLKRQMRFATLVMIEVLSMVASVVTGIICGLAGMGYWSLVLMQLVTPLFTTLGVWVACDWRPGLPSFGSGILPMLAYGSYQTLANLIAYFTRNIDTVLLGVFCGSNITGLYSKAFSLVLLPSQQIGTPLSSVVLPTLSRLQNEPKRYSVYYLKAIQALAYATMPLTAVMGALATQIVWLILGDQWIRAGLIFQILALAGLWLPVSISIIWVYLSLGQTKRMAVWFSMACPITILALVIGLPWGPEGVASGYAIVTWLLVYPLFAFGLKHTPIKVREVVMILHRPFVVSVLIFAGMFATQAYLREADIYIALLGALFVGTGILLLCLAVFVKLRTDLFGLVDTFKTVFPGHQVI
jgi:PST family polysaccharide transporter